MCELEYGGGCAHPLLLMPTAGAVRVVNTYVPLWWVRATADRRITISPVPRMCHTVLIQLIMLIRLTADADTKSVLCAVIGEPIKRLA